jgi:hypothetical protein
MSIEAVAVDGMTVEAAAPILELAMPRTSFIDTRSRASDELGVLLDVRAVAADVGNGEQRDELVDDGLLVLLAPLTRLACRRVVLRATHGRREQRGDTGHGADGSR